MHAAAGSWFIGCAVVLRSTGKRSRWGREREAEHVLSCIRGFCRRGRLHERCMACAGLRAAAVLGGHCLDCKRCLVCVSWCGT